MSIDVPRDPDELGDEDVRVARPVSFLRVGLPAARQLNWLQGFALGGPRAYAICDGISTTASPTYRFVCHRHPNCDFLDVAMLVRYAIIQTAPTVVVTAGTGASRTLTLAEPSDYYGWRMLRCPWGVADTGAQEVTIVCTDVSLAALLAYDCPRVQLGSGDNRLEHQDQDGPYAGLGIVEDWALAASQTAGARALIKEVQDAWDDCKPSIFSWPGDTSNALTVAAGAGWTDPFGGALFRGIARMKRSTDERRAVDWWAYTRTVSAGGTYQIRITSTNPGPGANSTITSGVLSNTAWGWQQLSTCMVDCTTDATFLFEMTAVAKNCQIAALCAVEE